MHYNWLASRSGKMKGEQRQELLSYHRSIELELLAISRLEKKIIDELAGAADWTTSEPWSEQAQVLRDRLTSSVPRFECTWRRRRRYSRTS